ncbi:hypothetical protein [Mycobacterium kyorinense]|uniref:Uncharacterized protein n=1 Tax=Mycobacterium kyorinense TaxID=487514 RepID=A0A1X1XWZ0_9MYCO|nr:hypothetical protein [Mycobacterium kyorinense]ORW03270.1 hypothetical protein AWC14_05520 [Mycobacterium kyorinense]
MARTFDLAKESQRFKRELDELLNHTICDGISLKSIVTSTSPQRTVIGYRITKDNQDVTEGIPVTTGGRGARFYLGLSIRLVPDDKRTHLTVASSVMILATAADVADESNILLHYDYERGKEDYPEAHLQICASSDAWRDAGRRLDGRERLLERLHLPVGDRRFRPTLEDLIEFLIREKLAKPRRGWESAIEASRARFRDMQLKAAVRRYPDTAVSELERLGYTITRPRE